MGSRAMMSVLRVLNKGCAGERQAFSASSQIMLGEEYKRGLQGQDRNEMTMLKAINDALRIALERNEK